ncbi:restriction endonuclease subunit S [Helicobacter pylori]|uniref:restriction endonuclease subunit S n=1 Tax=Helicobacter pylori TaxID=210 RepID=UPI0039C9E0D6
MDALTTPSNWQKVRLGDIAEIKRGASPRPIENPKWFCANSNVGWVRISDISKNSRFLYKTAQKLSKKGIEKSRFVKQNSLIMSMCATIGKPIITKIDTCIHDGFVVFENPRIDLNYLYYFLCYIEKEWLESGQQGSQVNLNVDLIKNKEVFCPKDLNEQIAIANILSALDRYLYSLDALILKKEGVKKALSFELLSQKKRLKGFNQNWQKVRLGDICEITTGSLDANEMVHYGKYRFYTCAKEYYFIDKYAFDTEAILISGNGAYVGYVHYYKGKFNAYQRTYVLDNFSEHIIFVKYFLTMFLQSHIQTNRNEGNTPYIVMATLKDFEILLPP